MKYALEEKVKIIGLIFAELSVFNPHVARTATLHTSWGLRLVFPGKCYLALSSVLTLNACVCLVET